MIEVDIQFYQDWFDGDLWLDWWFSDDNESSFEEETDAPYGVMPLTPSCAACYTMFS